MRVTSVSSVTRSSSRTASPFSIAMVASSGSLPSNAISNMPVLRANRATGGVPPNRNRLRANPGSWVSKFPSSSKTVLALSGLRR